MGSNLAVAIEVVLQADENIDIYIEGFKISIIDTIDSFNAILSII